MQPFIKLYEFINSRFDFINRLLDYMMILLFINPIFEIIIMNGCFDFINGK